jgi:MFS family permease
VFENVYLGLYGVSNPLPNIYWAAYVLGLISGGFLVNKFRRRKPLFLLFFVHAVIFILPLFFRTASMVPIFQAASGLVLSLLNIPSIVFFADVTKVYERGRNAGLVYSSGFLMVPAMYIMTSVSLDNWFILVSIGSVALGLIGLFIVKERINFKEWRKVPITTVIGDRTFQLVLLVAASGGFFYGIYQYILTVYALNIIPYIPSLIILSLFISVAALFGGVLVDRYGRKPTLAAGAFLYAVGFLIFYFNTTILGWLIMSIITAVATALMWPSIIYTLAADLAWKESRGSTIGLILTSFGIGTIAGQFLRDNILSASVTEISIFTIFAAFMIIMPVMMMRETLPPKEKISEMRDYIKKIKNKTQKDED